MIKSFSGMTLSNESVTGESMEMEDEADAGMTSSFLMPVTIILIITNPLLILGLLTYIMVYWNRELGVRAPVCGITASVGK